MISRHLVMAQLVQRSTTPYGLDADQQIRPTKGNDPGTDGHTFRGNVSLLPRQSNRKNKAVDRAVNIAAGPQSIDLLRDRLHEYLYLPDIMGGRTAAYRLALPPGSPSLGAKSVRIAHESGPLRLEHHSVGRLYC